MVLIGDVANDSVRAMLRAATAGDHARLDALVERFDLTRREGYRAFLSAHARLLPALEAAIAEAPLIPDWPERRRAAALARDMRALEITPFPVPIAPPSLATVAERIGAIYVLEGSRLGGAMLSRTVARALPQAPRAFLDHGAGKGLWPRFLGWLEARGRAERLDAMIAGARATFAGYIEAFRG